MPPSLAYLKDLPLHEMKIDKSFVMDYSNARNVAIVRAAIELSHNLGLLVMVEGVEDEATLLALTDTHCDVAQGYHIGRPMAADKVVAWMVESSRPCTRQLKRKVN